jgi:VanZ family protein
MRAVLRPRILIGVWLPVLVWMAVIFTASGDSMSGEHSSRLLGPLVKWIYPSVSAEALESIILGVRKCAHVGEYALLWWLSWRAFRESTGCNRGGWHWRPAFLALLLVLAYAASDELHQAFVPTRQASIIDVGIDGCGAAGGMLCLWGISRRRPAG